MGVWAERSPLTSAVEKTDDDADALLGMESSRLRPSWDGVGCIWTARGTAHDGVALGAQFPKADQGLRCGYREIDSRDTQHGVCNGR